MNNIYSRTSISVIKLELSRLLVIEKNAFFLIYCLLGKIMEHKEEKLNLKNHTWKFDLLNKNCTIFQS